MDFKVIMGKHLVSIFFIFLFKPFVGNGEGKALSDATLSNPSPSIILRTFFSLGFSPLSDCWLTFSHLLAASTAFLFISSKPFNSLFKTHICFFFLALLRYKRLLTLCKFKVYNMMMWYTYILQRTTKIVLAKTSVASHNYHWIPLL